MIFVLFLINATLFALALINFATIRHPRTVEDIQESVLVLLPVRNEEENIERILTELFTQEYLTQYRILVIDDNSEDRTYELAKRFESARVSIIKAPPPAPGWIGKVSALQAGFNSLNGDVPDVVISIDADVHFEADAIARAVTTLNSSGLDFISPYPRQIAMTWAERLIQPLLQWSWMSTVLLRGAEKFPMASTVICNGQFLAMKGSSLKAIGGFETVAHKVLDDIELGRSFVAAGFRGSVIDGSEISSTRMYSSFAEIKSGYGKSLHTAFGSIAGSIFAALFIAATGILPLLYSLDGNILAIAALIAIIGTRFISAAASSTRLRDSILHPLSSALFIYLLYFSWRNRGKTQWKGRTL
ncbi:COG1215 Glycosyltransferases, probably involved in cell wall biogenesis [Candidatus Nanopelagicaceae bacterium]